MSVPTIYLIDDCAARMADELARHLDGPGALRIVVGAPDDAANAVLIGSTMPFDAGELRSAAGVALLAAELAELDRVRMALAGQDRTWIAALPDPVGIVAAERALGLLLQLARMHGTSLSGSAIGLLGFGEMGARLAGLLGALGATVRYWSPASDARVLERQRGQELRTGARPAQFDVLLRESDALVVTVSDQPGEQPLVGRAELALMRDGALLVNTTSATALDDGALIQALRGGYLSGVALGRTNLEPLPPDSPLHTFERVVLSPVDAESERELAARMLAADVARRLARRPELHLEPRRVRHVARRRPRHHSDEPKGR